MDYDTLKIALLSKDTRIRTAAFLDLYRPECLQAMGTKEQEKLRNIAFKNINDNPKIRAKLDAWLRERKILGQTKNDIFQDIYIQFDQALVEGRFKGNSDIMTYFLGIGYFLIAGAQRRIPRVKWKDAQLPDSQKESKPIRLRQEILSDTTIKDFTSFSDKDFMDFADAMTAAEYTEVEKELLEEMKDGSSFLSNLTPSCQQYLQMYYYERMKMKEIAQDERVNANNTQVANNEVARCRKHLRELMNENSLFKKLKNLLK